jgi:hypothetical protein
MFRGCSYRCGCSEDAFKCSEDARTDADVQRMQPNVQRMLIQMRMFRGCNQMSRGCSYRCGCSEDALQFNRPKGPTENAVAPGLTRLIL